MSDPQLNKDNAPQGIISMFAQHKVAANLLMVIMLILGLVALKKLNTQFFPNFALDYISVAVSWPNASSEDVEKSLTSRVENELKSINNVKEMTSTSSYGSSSVLLEFNQGTDMGPALDQVKDAVGKIRDLPTDAEKPEISQVINYETVARLLITSSGGNLNELRPLAHKFEHQLLNQGISKVNIVGLPSQEMAIQMSSEQLDSLDMSLTDVAQKISQQSQDIPAGEIGNNESTRQLRSVNQGRTAKQFKDMLLKSDSSPNLIKLGNIADIKRRPMQHQLQVFYKGHPAIELELLRTDNADALKSADILNQWLKKVQPNLPKGVSIVPYQERWQLIKERINLLLKNGLSGLVLVLAVLFLFMNGRIALWVAVGIPVSFMAALFVLYMLGGSINMISLFGLIMTLGIIVDDAIVVGEDALSHYQKGERSLMAAEGGAMRMLAPVMSSSLTTIASFLPLMMISGVIGNILFDIPFVVICVIIASLVECFLILPGHMRHTFHSMHHQKPGKKRQYLDDKFNYFRDEIFLPIVTKAVNYRWTVIMGTIAMLIMAVGLLASGRIAFNFFPSPEGTKIVANVSFVAGTPRVQVQQFLTTLNQSLSTTEKQFKNKVVSLALTRLGYASGSSGDRFGSIQIEMVSPEQRSIRNIDFINAWKKNIKQTPAGVENFTITEARGGPPGSDLDIRLSGASAQKLKHASLDLQTKLKSYIGVSSIEDDLPYGQEQMIYHLKKQGTALGLTVKSIGNQLRAAFAGQRIQIFQDGDDEVEVRVMLPDKERYSLASLEKFTIKLPNGSSTLLSNVVTFDPRQGFDTLSHTDGQLSINVTATVDPKVTNNNVILTDLKKTFLPQLISKYGLDIHYEGRAKEQKETLSDMLQGMLLSFAIIYIILAWVFASYGWPLIVMAVIPFGLTGALFGHWVMGVDLTILSLFGIFGLSGIVINDSIILVTFFKELKEAGVATQQAIIEAARLRLRAVLLTSLTTIGGLLPLLFETSRQAQFLIPMAISISFGLMFSTVLVLIVIPAMLSVYESIMGRKQATKSSLTTS